MNAHGTVPWNWRPDSSPPAPCGAVAWHDVARRLHARLGQLAPSIQARLQLSASRDVLVVTGEATDLPWLPGIAYAARCDEAPMLWRPTALRPDVPTDLLARSLKRLHEREPLLLWPDPATVIPLDRLARVSAASLALIARRWQGA